MTTVTTTTTGSTITSTSGNCVWVCYDEYQEPFVASIATTVITTTTTTVTTIAKDLKIIIVGNLVLTVPDAAAFMYDDVAKNALAAGIADALGLPGSYVTVVVKPWSGKMRRLGDAVTAEYTATIPADAASALKTEASKTAMTVTIVELTNAVHRRVTAEKGAVYVVTVNSKDVPEMRGVTVKGKVGTASCSLPQFRYQLWNAIATFLVLFACRSTL
jgi:hypothetical protein